MDVLTPRTIRTANRAGRALARVGIKQSLDPVNLLQTAQKAANLDDLGGDDAFAEGLRRLTESLDGEGGLTPLGRHSARQRILGLLDTRLRLLHAADRLAAEPITRPVFIVGLPRTGTTVLHGMVATDPALRAPAYWEVHYPLPAAADVDPERVQRAEQGLAALRRLAPRMDQIHPMEALLPEECTFMQSPQFLSYEFAYSFRVPSYWEWLQGQDLRPSFAMQKLFLQHLQSAGRRGRHWVLKAPANLMWLDALLAVFPDAALVFTHRDPATVLASVSSLVCNFRAATSWKVDPVAVGREMLQTWSWGMERAMQVRDRMPANRVVDVMYDDLVARPVETLERLYDDLALDGTPGVAARARAFLGDHPREKHGKHSYSLEDFGLHRAEVDAAFQAYRERFGLDT